MKISAYPGDVYHVTMPKSKISDANELLASHSASVSWPSDLLSS